MLLSILHWTSLITIAFLFHSLFGAMQSIDHVRQRRGRERPRNPSLSYVCQQCHAGYLSGGFFEFIQSEGPPYETKKRCSSCRLGISIGNLSNDDDDGNKNGKKQQVLRLSKQQLCTCITLFRSFQYISLPSVHDYDVKVPNFTFGVNARRLPFSFSEL